MKITTHPIKTRGGEHGSHGRLSAICGARWNRLRRFSFLEAATEQKYGANVGLCFGMICVHLHGGNLLYWEGCNLNIHSYDN